MNPTVSHVVWDLNLQRRIAEAQRDSAARSVGRKKVRGRWPWSRRELTGVADGSALRPATEDVSHALRFW